MAVAAVAVADLGAVMAAVEGAAAEVEENNPGAPGWNLAASMT